MSRYCAESDSVKQAGTDIGEKSENNTRIVITLAGSLDTESVISRDAVHYEWSQTSSSLFNRHYIITEDGQGCSYIYKHTLQILLNSPRLVQRPS